MTEAEMQSIMRRDAEAAVRALRARVAELEREVERRDGRERHFAKVLSVADGGRYRNDWDAAIESVVKARDAAESRASAAVEAHAQLLSRIAADGTLDAMERAAAAEQRAIQLACALDSADCTQREGGDARHCRIESPCWRCRAEAAEQRVRKLEAEIKFARQDADAAKAVASEASELRNRWAKEADAAERRAKRMEGALEAAATVIRDHLADSYPVVLDEIDAALAASESEVSDSPASSDRCECGADDWNTSATLIACRSCGRTWGRCNGKWVLDPESVPKEMKHG